MRKLFFAATMLLLSQAGFGQAVNDQAIIPVSVTLNSILRLTVVSGGNIDFVVNTIGQYTSGINNGGGDARYQTNFTVSASQDFDVTIRAEDATFIGQDNATNTMPLDNVGLDLSESGTGNDPANWALPTAVLALTNGAQNIVTGVAGAAAGGADKNNFTIRWRLGTGEGAMNTSTLLAQSLTPDRYITNVFLELVPK
ncbi:MAG TPA: hypothetical protein ENN49_06820 [Bacteroidales bacterium]|nr:hypothetical protein [Bacteroidales bacterium]